MRVNARCPAPRPRGRFNPLDLLRQWRRRAIDRAELGRLDTHQLRDIGLNPEAIEREVAKPFWRA